MVKIRPARKEDKIKIIELLKETDLYYPAQNLNHFLVAEINQKVVGALQLKKYKNYFFLSSLGVKKTYEKQGIATSLLNYVQKNYQAPIYLYTIIPSFFAKFGFKPAKKLPRHLPSKDLLGCQDCQPQKCQCLVWMPA